MSNLLFLAIFFTVLIYLTIHIISSYKIIRLNLMNNCLETSALNDANFSFKVSLFSIGILFGIFTSFYIPKSFSLYINISVCMLVYVLGLVFIYTISNKTAKELFYMNLLINIVNVTMFLFPILIILIANTIQ